MFKISCKDVHPDVECDYEATGDTEKEAVDMMLEHIRREHPDKMEGMNDEEMRAILESNIREV